jgi:2-polyprenyl-6-methoxyphenol hydroxylase-like FAD-dependent oxidoreductase
MELFKDKKVLVSGASIAGLSTAWWMNKLGYRVTVVEIENEPRIAGGAVNIEGTALNATKRMGIFEQLKANRLHVDLIELKMLKTLRKVQYQCPARVSDFLTMRLKLSGISL